MADKKAVKNSTSNQGSQSTPFQNLLDIVGAISDGFFTLDSEWRFTYLNSQAAAHLGVSAGSVIDKVIWEALPSLKGSILDVECHRAAREHSSISLTARISQQSDRILEFRVLPTTSGVAAHSIDVTEQNRVAHANEERETRSQRLIDAAPAYISYLDTEYRYRVVNKAYETNFGYPPNTVIGRTISEVVGPQGWPIIGPYIERAMSGEAVSFEREATYPTLGTRWVRGTFTPDIDETGQVRGVMICVVDITELKRVQETLRTTAEELRHINDVAPVGIWVSHDPSCAHITGNIVGQRMLNATAGENLSAGSVLADPEEATRHNLGGRTFFDDQGRKLSVHQLPMQQSILRNCEIRDQIVTFKDAEDRQLTLFGSAVPLHNERGEVRGSVGCFVDVTTRIEAEHALRESEERLRLAVTASGIGYWSWNLQTGLCDIDERTAEIFGVAIDTQVAALFDRIIDEDRERVQREVQASITGTGRFRSEFRVIGEGSTPRWVFGLGDIFSNPNDRTKKFSGVSLDISERKRLEEERHRFVSLVENSTEFIGMCDLQGIPFYFNEAGLRMVGLDSLEEALGKKVEDFIFPEDRDFLRNEFHPRVLREGRGEVELRFRHFKTGEARWMIHTVFPVRDRDDNIVGLATVNRDITDRKHAEQLLKDADRRKDEFLATLGHELRNPLAPISNALHILPSVDNQPHHVRRLGELMSRQVEQLKHLIDDLLDVSRISRGKITLRKEEFDLRDAVSGAVEVARPLIDARGHELCIEMPTTPVPINGDRGRLMQVFGNLLHNAAKYTDPRGRIELSVHAHHGTGVVKILDTGLGIPSEMLGSIFDPFTQVSGTLDRSQGGLGIGLTLVKTLIELHGGTVEAHSEGTGKGSEFIVRLPLLEAETSAIPPELLGKEGKRLELRRHRVLVVDDLKPSADTLAMLLESFGQETSVAYSAMSALERAKEFQPDVVVSDIAMPGMDGYRLAQELRYAYGEKPLLVALTGYGQEHDRTRAHKAGFNRHLVKPANMDALRELLESLDYTASQEGAHGV